MLNACAEAPRFRRRRTLEPLRDSPHRHAQHTVRGELVSLRSRAMSMHTTASHNCTREDTLLRRFRCLHCDDTVSHMPHRPPPVHPVFSQASGRALSHALCGATSRARLPVLGHDASVRICTKQCLASLRMSVPCLRLRLCDHVIGRFLDYAWHPDRLTIKVLCSCAATTRGVDACSPAVVCATLTPSVIGRIRV